MTALLPFVEYV